MRTRYDSGRSGAGAEAAERRTEDGIEAVDGPRRRRDGKPASAYHSPPETEPERKTIDVQCGAGRGSGRKRAASTDREPGDGENGPVSFPYRR